MNSKHVPGDIVVTNRQTFVLTILCSPTDFQVNVTKGHWINPNTQCLVVAVQTGIEGKYTYDYVVSASVAGWIWEEWLRSL